MSENLEAEVALMIAELEKYPDFMPSEYWKNIGAKTYQMLVDTGLENLKRTVATNYFTWMIFYMNDPQFRNVVLKWFRYCPNLKALFFRFEGDRLVQTASQEHPVALTASEARRYGMFVSMLWDIGRMLDSQGLLEKVCEPELGNPLRIFRDGKLISQDLVNSALELTQILNCPLNGSGNLRIAEFGAGYGRLAHLFHATQKGQYFIFDIPPALNVSQWYLSKLFPEKQIFRFRPFSDWEEIADEVAASEIAFFTSNQLSVFPTGYFNVLTSISTLPEMSDSQVRRFLPIFGRVAQDYIYLKQWSSWKNPLDGTNLSVDSYYFGENWQLQQRFTDPINPLFFNGIWKRLNRIGS